MLAHEGGENVAQDILWEATSALAYEPEKPIFSLTDENAILNPLRAGMQFGGGVFVAGGLSASRMALETAAANIRNIVTDARIMGYVSPQTADALMFEIDAAFPFASRKLEDMESTDDGLHHEALDALNPDDSLAQTYENGIMGEQDNAGGELEGIGNPDSQTTASAGDIGQYTQKIKWGIQDIEVSPAGKGFWGQRIQQINPRVDAYELKINPNNESYYLKSPAGGYVQYENMTNDVVMDGKLVIQKNRFTSLMTYPISQEIRFYKKPRGR